MVERLWNQTHHDVFFMDWERSRGKIETTDGASHHVPVSIWRTLFCANEYQEMDNERLISLEACLFFLLFFLRGLGLLFLAAPRSDEFDFTASNTDPILRFAVVGFFWLLVSGVQVLWMWGFKNRFISDPAGDFVDLVSCANISVFILVEPYYGYYLHGRSPHQYVDTDMLQMSTQFKKEEDNLCAKRGLVTDTDLQTFEIYITKALRENYDRVFLSLLAEDGLLSRVQDQARLRELLSKEMDGGNMGSLLNIASMRRKLRKLPTAQVVEAYGALNRFFCGFIDNTNGQHSYVVLDKTWLEKLLHFPPEVASSGRSVFFNDSEYAAPSFVSCTLRGMEYSHTLFNALTYLVIDAFTVNTFFAVIGCYVLDCIFVWLRKSLGGANLSKKTLVDGKFLL